MLSAQFSLDESVEPAAGDLLGFSPTDSLAVPVTVYGFLATDTIVQMALTARVAIGDSDTASTSMQKSITLSDVTESGIRTVPLAPTQWLGYWVLAAADVAKLANCSEWDVKVTIQRNGTAYTRTVLRGAVTPAFVAASQGTPSVSWSSVKVIVEGDSFTAGVGTANGSGYAARLIAAITALGGSGASFGYSGQTAVYGAGVFDVDAGAAFDITKTNYFLIEFAPNDLLNAAGGGVLGDAFFNGLAQLVRKALNKRAAGYTVRIGILTPPDRDDATAISVNYRTPKVMAAAWLRANYKALGADFLVDTAAFYRIGADGAADNVTAPLGLFSADKIHPNDNGHFLYYLRCLGAIYEDLGLTLPTGTAATNLAGCFEPGVCAKGLGTYLPVLLPRQSNVTDLIQNPTVAWANWDESNKNIHFGPMDLPFTNPTGFSLTLWMNVTAADIAASERRALACDVTTSAMFASKLSTGKWQFAVFYANNGTNQFDQVTAPSALTVGIHTVGVTFNPAAARGSRLTMYVDGTKLSNLTVQQAGADGLVTRPTVIPWSDDVVLGDNLFHGSAPLDYHQAVAFLDAYGVLTDVQMKAQSDHFLGRWLAGVT